MEPDEAQNLSQIPRKQRAVLRKALGGDFRVTVDKDVDAFYRLFSRGTILSASCFPSVRSIRYIKESSRWLSLGLLR
jgi:hypothetical protein